MSKKIQKLSKVLKIISKIILLIDKTNRKPYFVYGLLFLLCTCNVISREIAVVNKTSSCESFILINYVENKLKIVRENHICNNNSDWNTDKGAVIYQGKCEYLVIPKCKNPGELLHLISKGDSLEFFVVEPEIKSICISNFGCKTINKKKNLNVYVYTDYDDLEFNEIEYNYEVYKNNILVLFGQHNSFTLPFEVQNLSLKLQKNDFIKLKNIFLKSTNGFEIKVDSITNYYARNVFH